jgi:CheY-like chemotaxis protein
VVAAPSDSPTDAPASDATDADRPTVLVVDDNADIRAFVRRHLASTYRVVEAADGADGLDQARDLTPDCIVADVMMPRMDGIAMLDALRSDAATDFIPVVLLTARAALEDKMEGLDAGADDYLTKPFRPDELQTRIRNLLAQRMRLRERFQAEASEAEDPSEADDAPPFLQEVAAVIRERIGDEDLTVNTLAEAVGVSRSTLYRELGTVTEASPAELIWQVRLQQARTLLEDGAGNVSEVAYGVGFKSVSHFSRRFRDRFGTPPSAVPAGTSNAETS